MSRRWPRDGSTAQQEEAVAKQYDRWARVYDVLWRRYENKTLPVVLHTASIRSGERVLDLACGTGELERRLVEAVPGATVVGVDISPAMIDRARSKLDGTPGVRFEWADVHRLPFEEDAFDVAICANSFHYFTHPEQVLEEAARVVRPGGRLVVLDWCRDYWTCRLMDTMLQWLDPAHHTCYTLGELIARLEAASFEVQNSFRYRFDFVWGMMGVEAVLSESS